MPLKVEMKPSMTREEKRGLEEEPHFFTEEEKEMDEQEKVQHQFFLMPLQQLVCWNSCANSCIEGEEGRGCSCTAGLQDHITMKLKKFGYWKILIFPKSGWTQHQGGEGGRRGLWLQIHHLPFLDMQNNSVETIDCCRLKELLFSSRFFPLKCMILFKFGRSNYSDSCQGSVWSLFVFFSPKNQII